jgi:carbon monoxide dehydrogenase subunit G
MPSVSASEEFEIKSSIERCWALVSDLSSVGACIPGQESVTPIDATSASLKVKLKVGYLSRTLELKAKIKESSPPNHFSFFAEGSDAEITGTIDLVSANGSTKLKYQIEINPISVTGKTAMAMMGKDLVKKQASEFASCVKSRLEK